METFSFIPPMNLIGEDKWVMGVFSFEATNFVLNNNHRNSSFSTSLPGHWNSDVGEELVTDLNKFLELKSENDIGLHVKEVKKRGTRKEIELSG